MEISQIKKSLVVDYVALRNTEESFIKQRSRVKWLALGDQNTRYFHQKLCSHRVKNTILSSNAGEGNRLDDPEAIRNEILGSYIGSLGTSFAQKVDAKVQLQQAITTKVSLEAQHLLTSPVSK